MTSTGRRDTLVSIQRYTAVPDEYGEEVKTWSEIASEWAAVYFGTGNERRTAAQEQGDQAATFNVLANERTRGVMIRDRIVVDGEQWDIVSKSPIKRSEIDLVAKRAPS